METIFNKLENKLLRERGRRGGRRRERARGSDFLVIISWRVLFDMQVSTNALVESLVVETVHLMGSRGRHPLTYG